VVYIIIWCIISVGSLNQEPLGYSLSMARWSTERDGGQIRIGLTKKTGSSLKNITYQHDIVCSPKRMPETTRE